jgi:hypothetical protein
VRNASAFRPLPLLLSGPSLSLLLRFTEETKVRRRDDSLRDKDLISGIPLPAHMMQPLSHSIRHAGDQEVDMLITFMSSQSSDSCLSGAPPVSLESNVANRF